MYIRFRLLPFSLYLHIVSTTFNIQIKRKCSENKMKYKQ